MRSSSAWPPPRATPAWGSCSTSSPTTWPPTRPTATGPIPSCARSSSTSTRSPGATGGSSTSTISPASGRRTRTCSRRTHALVLLALVRDGLVDGLRVDHPDGLADPAGYLARLRERGAERVWVEKILDPGERLRDWPVCGTVGYEFLNDVCALFVDPAGEAPLTALWERVSGDDRGFGEVALECKLEQARGTFCARDRAAERGRSVTIRCGARSSWRGRCPRCPVYRTYVDPAADGGERAGPRR